MVQHLPIFGLACVRCASFDTRSHIRVLRHLSAPAPAVFCVFSWPHLSPPICRITFTIWALIARPSNRSVFPPAAIRVSRVLSQHTCWFKFSTTSIRRFPVFVRQSKVFLTNRRIRRPVNSLTPFLCCCGKFRQVSGSVNRRF